VSKNNIEYATNDIIPLEGQLRNYWYVYGYLYSSEEKYLVKCYNFQEFNNFFLTLLLIYISMAINKILQQLVRKKILYSA